MKYFGQKSLSSVLRTLFKILFYISIIGSVLGVILLIIINTIGPMADKVEWSFTINGMTLGITNPSGNYPYALLIPNFLLMIPIIWLCRKMWSFFENLAKEEIFTTQNFQLIKSSGLLIIVAGFVKSINNFISVNAFFGLINQGKESINLRFSILEPWNIILKQFDFDGYFIKYSLISEPGLILSGLAILFFAHLFNKALLIQEENDLTI